MYILAFALIFLNTQVVRPCPLWVFPGDTPDDCCMAKTVGKFTYQYIEKNEDAVNDFHCINDCVYYRDGDKESRYCFRTSSEHDHGIGGIPVCVSNLAENIQCSQTTEMEVQSQWDASLERVKFNLVKLKKEVEEFSVLEKTYYEFILQQYKLTIEIFTPEQIQLLVNSKPCDEIRMKCDQCFRGLTVLTIQCFGFQSVDNCTRRFPNITATCNSCLCEISHKCDPNITCKEGNTPVIATASGTKHPCDRKCRSEDQKQCVFDLTFDDLQTNANGPTADGRIRKVQAYNGQIPGPSMVICEGDDLVVNLVNNSTTDTTLHLHGVRDIYRPWADGVPYVTQCPILPTKNFTYGLKVINYDVDPGSLTRPGTYWYHSNVREQRTDGAYGALIIRPIQDSILYDNDLTENHIMLQEWYKSPDDKTITSILINGMGKSNESSWSTNYNEYKVSEEDAGSIYLFRVIGAISEDIPLRLSIEGHTFTAIAIDSGDIEPVYNLTTLWIAAAERFNIAVRTKKKEEYEKQEKSYKITVIGHENPNLPDRRGPYCTIAWLTYPGQTIDEDYTANCTSALFNLPDRSRILNPVPINFDEWDARLKYPEWNDANANGSIFITDLRAIIPNPTINLFNFSQNDNESGLNNTQYLEIKELTFNGYQMEYPNVPFLLQTAEYVKDHQANRCGSICDITVNPTIDATDALATTYVVTNCSSKIPDGCTNGCQCQHINVQPYVPAYWVDIVVINNYVNATAHPIHLHGGWFWVMAMEKFNYDITGADIKKKNEECETGNHCLWKNFNLPPSKDTIQVPPGGYVLLRSPLANKGAWLLHCHINKHLNAGMAMVLQIGGFGFSNTLNQDWCTGDLAFNENCKP